MPVPDNRREDNDRAIGNTSKASVDVRARYPKPPLPNPLRDLPNLMAKTRTRPRARIADPEEQGRSARALVRPGAPVGCDRRLANPPVRLNASLNLAAAATGLCGKLATIAGTRQSAGLPAARPAAS